MLTEYERIRMLAMRFAPPGGDPDRGGWVLVSHGPIEGFPGLTVLLVLGCGDHRAVAFEDEAACDAYIHREAMHFLRWQCNAEQRFTGFAEECYLEPPTDMQFTAEWATALRRELDDLALPRPVPVGDGRMFQPFA